MPKTKPTTAPNTEIDWESFGPEASKIKNAVERLQSRCYAFSVATGYDLCEILSSTSRDPFTTLLKQVIRITPRFAQRCMAVARADAKCDPLHMLEQMPDLLPDIPSSPNVRHATTSAITDDDSSEANFSANVVEVDRNTLEETGPKPPKPVAAGQDTERRQSKTQPLIGLASGVEHALRQRKAFAEKGARWVRRPKNGGGFVIVYVRPTKRNRKKR